MFNSGTSFLQRIRFERYPIVDRDQVALQARPDFRLIETPSFGAVKLGLLLALVVSVLR